MVEIWLQIGASTSPSSPMHGGRPMHKKEEKKEKRKPKKAPFCTSFSLGQESFGFSLENDTNTKRKQRPLMTLLAVLFSSHHQPMLFLLLLHRATYHLRRTSIAASYIYIILDLKIYFKYIIMIQIIYCNLKKKLN